MVLGIGIGGSVDISSNMEVINRNIFDPQIKSN